MWQRLRVNPDKTYVLQLCQNSKRVRYFTARELNEPSHPDMVLETMPVPAELIAKYDFEQLRSVRLANGEMFSFGPHGEWFTQAESTAMRARRGWDSIPWHNGVEPQLPPK